MESDTGLAVDSNRAIGIELMEQVTERVIWTAMDQATEITMTGGCVYTSCNLFWFVFVRKGNEGLCLS